MFKCLITNTEYFCQFQTAKSGLYHEIWKRAEQSYANGHSYPRHMEDKVLKGKYVFVSSTLYLDLVVEHCDVHVATNHFHFIPCGIPVAKDFKYISIFNERFDHSVL